MKKKLLMATLALGLSCEVFAVNANSAAAPVSAPAQPLLNSGINTSNFASQVRPQDDFYQFVNGHWLATTQIPADKSSWGAFNILRENSLNQLHTIMQQLKSAKMRTLEQQKLLDLYASYMDEKRLTQLGATPLTPLFSQVNELESVNQLPALMAKLSAIGVNTPYDLAIHQDAKISQQMIADLSQGGLGLPDRDYYLSPEDPNLTRTKQLYQAHIAKMLSLLGDKDSESSALEIVRLETELSKIQWSKVANRDPNKTYNKYLLSDLAQLAPNYPWADYLTASGLESRVSYVIVSQPSYISGFNQLLQTEPLAVWQKYLRWQILNSFGADLSQAFESEQFAFNGTVLRGIPQNQVRWKRGLALVEAGMGEALGKLYVAEYFPPQNKARVEKLVANLIEAYSQSIDDLSWMTPATKRKAQEKLAALMLKIGYPTVSRDYSQLVIKPDSLLANVQAANQFEYDRELAKLGKPVDRSEWGMTAQTVNAYYNPELNEIVFPAAILQPPFFDAKVDDAVNYGGIGAVIGHEISHGFDDQGSQYDAKGNLHDWFSAEDHAKFQQKTAALVKQYAAYSPVAGYNVNGELTLGENIADNSGLAIAYKAYILSLRGKDAPVLDGMSGSQRFYISWANVWQNKTRPAQAVVNLKSDPHSPAEIRGNATLRNQPGFYSAFDVKPSDKMYLAPAERVTIW